MTEIDRDTRKVVNTSGFQPCEFKVLCKPDKVEEMKGSIYIPDNIREKEMKEQVDVTLIAIGGNAFQEWQEPKPHVGNRVKIARYAGFFFKGHDGEWYQLCNDQDIAGINIKEPMKEFHETDLPDFAGDGEKYGHLRSQ